MALVRPAARRFRYLPTRVSAESADAAWAGRAGGPPRVARVREGGRPTPPHAGMGRPAVHPARRRDGCPRSPRRAGTRAGFARAPPAPGRPYQRLPPVGRGGARVLDRVRRVLGRDDARPAAARAPRRRLRADAPADRHADRPGDPRRNVPPGRSLAGGRRDPRPRGRRLAPAHVRPKGVRYGHGSPVLRGRADALPREGGIMSLDHEAQAKERAREYFRTKGTQLPVPVIRERIADAVRALDEFLAPLSAEQAARATVPGEWTIHEIVDHLIETYRPGLDELWCLLAGRRPPGEPIPAGLQSKAPLLRPWPWLRDELRRVHAEVLNTLDAVPPDFRTDAKAPLVMVVNVKDAQEKTTPLTWVEDLDWKSYAIVSWRLHAIDHLNHARKVLAAAGT